MSDTRGSSGAPIMVTGLPYTAMNSSSKSQTSSLSELEIAKIRNFLAAQGDASGDRSADIDDLQSTESVYDEFADSTHAWAVFAEDPANKARTIDRSIGCLIICLQLLTYWLFAAEAIEDYRKGIVPVSTTHYYCGLTDEKPNRYFTCEADTTNHWDAFVAFALLGIFLSSDAQQAWRVMRAAPTTSSLAFASFAGIEVVAAFLAAVVSISQKLYIGEVSDGIEAGVGLLFVRELSSRAYSAIRQKKKKKQYVSFACVLGGMIILGLIIDPICERMFAP